MTSKPESFTQRLGLDGAQGHYLQPEERDWLELADKIYKRGGRFTPQEWEDLVSGANLCQSLYPNSILAERMTSLIIEMVYGKPN